MNYSEVLQKYLLRIARGELLEITSVLPLVKSAKIFLPQIKQNDSEDLIKITFPIVHKNGEQLVPIYLSRSNSMSYTGTLTNLRAQFHDPIEIKGEILFQVIPPEYGIIIEPSSSLEVIFPRDKLQHFLHPEEQNIYAQPNLHVIPGGKEEQNSLEIGADLAQTGIIDDLDPPIDKTAEVEQQIIGNKYSINQLEKELTEIIEVFHAVDEAYILEHSSPHSELIVGLLAKEWSGDERFRVVESIALLSKQVFGYAGAIEVYDDLHDTHSSSWDLFKMIPPFYTKNDPPNLALNDNKLLNTHIEVTPQKRGIRGSMSKITQTGLKLFSGIGNIKQN